MLPDSNSIAIVPLANIGQSSTADSHLLQMMPLSRIFFMKILTLDWDERKKMKYDKYHNIGRYI